MVWKTSADREERTRMPDPDRFFPSRCTLLPATFAEANWGDTGLMKGNRLEQADPGVRGGAQGGGSQLQILSLLGWEKNMIFAVLLPTIERCWIVYCTLFAMFMFTTVLVPLEDR